MFRSRSGILPAANKDNNGRGKWNFSNLHDGSDDDDDNFEPPVKAIAAKSNEEKKKIEAKLLAINQRVAELEEDDDDGELEKVKSNFNYGGYNQKQQYNNHHEDSEEMSVASENLSVGPENSEEESFSMGH
jgi:hypothetical protein